MNRGIVRTVLFAGVLAGMMMAASQADAGWGHFRGYYGAPYVGWSGYSYSYHGGWGGGYGGCCGTTYASYAPAYYGSYGGCCDPCYTSYRSCYRGGCGLLARWKYRCRSHHYGYYAGCGNSCYTPTCCSSCGYSSCDCGVGGGVIDYGTPVIDSGVPVMESGPTPADPPAAGTDMLPEQQTSLNRDSALLTVNVPSNARVLVNGVVTRSTGDIRRYVSRNLTPGFDYTYEIKAETMVDGQPVVQTKTVQLRAGQNTRLAFDAPAIEIPETSLTLHVPDNAKVFLAGNQTNGDGEVRTFRTTKLSQGQAWQDYVVRVVVNNETKEETITLRAGDDRELTFDFGFDKVASVR